MSQVLLMFRKEMLNFVRGDRSVLFVYLILVAGWGILLATLDKEGIAAPLWTVFFSIIVAVNFSSTVFVLERMTGALEVLLTCGMARSAILGGKMLFVVAMTLLTGACCLGCALLLRAVVPGAAGSAAVFFSWHYCLLYTCAAFLNAASSAYLSVVLPNPRLLHFVNLLIAGTVMAAYTAIALVRPVPVEAASAALAMLGICFTLLAIREFGSERIAKPVVL